VYRWLRNVVARKKADADDLKSLPEIKTKEEWVKKIHPGKFAGQPQIMNPHRLTGLVFFKVFLPSPIDPMPSAQTILQNSWSTPRALYRRTMRRIRPSFCSPRRECACWETWNGKYFSIRSALTHVRTPTSCYRTAGLISK
jgi:hypothetical protein